MKELGDLVSQPFRPRDDGVFKGGAFIVFVLTALRTHTHPSPHAPIEWCVSESRLAPARRTGGGDAQRAIWRLIGRTTRRIRIQSRKHLSLSLSLSLIECCFFFARDARATEIARSLSLSLSHVPFRTRIYISRGRRDLRFQGLEDLALLRGQPSARRVAA